MKVRTIDLKEGCIISEDVFSLTNRPIVASKTVVKKETIEILKAFLIKEVNIEKIQVNGSSFNKAAASEEENNKNKEGENK